MMLRLLVGKQIECGKVLAPMRHLRKSFVGGRLSEPRQQWQYLITGQVSSAVQPSNCSYKPAAGLPVCLTRAFTTLSQNSCVSPLHPAISSVTVVRFRRRKVQRKTDLPRTATQDEDELTDEEGEEDSDSETSAFFEEDSSLTSSYREMTTHVKSARLDAIVSAGLGIARSQLEETFLSSDLRLNGERLKKKSQQLQKGDYVDLIVSSEDGKSQVKRVRVLAVEEPGESGKQKVYLRVWRSPQDV